MNEANNLSDQPSGADQLSGAPDGQSVVADNTNDATAPSELQTPSQEQPIDPVPTQDTLPENTEVNTPTENTEVNNAVENAPAVEEKPLPEFAQANPERQEVPEILEASQRVMFEGRHVTSVLRDGRELRTADGMVITHYHCTLEDGTTAHVPVELFR